MDHKVNICVGDREIQTLADILPDVPGLEILFIAKTPALISVNVGHYFQGTQGRMFWNKLSEYNILNVPYGEYEDDHLIENRMGITDIVKQPRNYGSEPSDFEYKEGMNRILKLIEIHKPKVIVFVYKKVLDQILKIGLGIRQKSKYGFNPHLKEEFGSEVFVFPMPGTPCTSNEASASMSELKLLLSK